MSLTIELPPEAERTLEERARSAGLDASAYAAQLLRQSLRPARPIEEISGAIYERFLRSGVSDEELGEELERAKHEMRVERRARGG